MKLLNKWDLKQQMAVVASITGILISLTIFLPVCTYFEFNETENGIVERVVYGFETLSVLTHFYCFTCVAVAAFTFNRTILRITNIMIWTFFSIKFLAVLLFSNPYAIYGPIAPRTEVGYILSFFMVLMFLITSFFWRRKFDSIKINRNQTIVLGSITGILVCSPIIWFISVLLREGL
ncbi:hypothetical protein [Fluviicola taffensis]|uniref:Uncharacterized protein n=1 Tax=Fluviicola taffensis (strain DSM 16823 / NCIMB 13979 / RW262) TaxID=755732 RepID=F2ICY6_FLUTR|nr:hypothetical protein [Fluviicola taffensis]AEA43360.1 hypothetical protein Fluta_1366 [Fluviicola taffensis DSM 16823]